MKLVKHLLDRKGRDIISVATDASVLDAITIMADKSIGSLLVMQDDELLGIVTERDYARKVIVKGRSSKTTAVVCGPPVMYKFVLYELHKLGLADAHIYMSLERHMKCGVGKCGHCQVGHSYACQDGPVYRYSDIRTLREAI